MIDTVIFDIGNVLIDFRWHWWMKNLHGDDSIIKRINAAMWNDGRWAELDRGVKSDAEIMASFIMAEPSLEREIRLTFERVADCMFPFPHTVPWIQSLKEAGHKVLYLSNYSAHLIGLNPEALDFLDLMDGGVFSCNVHALKPEREIYERICAEYNLVPKNCVFIDDLKDNIAAARAFGMKGVVFHNYEQADAELHAIIGIRDKI